MIDLRRLAEDLSRRQRVAVALQEDQLTLPMDGEEIFLTNDEPYGRVVLWSEVTKPESQDMLQAAEISLRYNDEFAYSRAVTLAVSTAAGCVLLGRSMEAGDIDSGRVLSEAQEFCSELRAAKSWFSQAARVARDKAPGASPARAEQIQNYVRI